MPLTKRPVAAARLAANTAPLIPRSRCRLANGRSISGRLPPFEGQWDFPFQSPPVVDEMDLEDADYDVIDIPAFVMFPERLLNHVLAKDEEVRHREIALAFLHRNKLQAFGIRIRIVEPPDILSTLPLL